MEIDDQRLQLDRAAYEIGAIARASEFYGSLRVLNWLLILLEIIAAGFAGFHFLHGNVEYAMFVLLIEVGILLVHTIVIFIERQLHSNHRLRIWRLQRELKVKANDLLTVM